MQVHDDLKETKEQLSASKKETQRQKDRGDITFNALRNTIETQEISKYKIRLLLRIGNFLLGTIVIAGLIYIIYSLIKNNFEDSNSQSIAFILSIVSGLVFEMALWIYGYCNIKEIFKNKQKYIIEQTNIKLSEALKNNCDEKY